MYLKATRLLCEDILYQWEISSWCKWSSSDITSTAYFPSYSWGKMELITGSLLALWKKKVVVGRVGSVKYSGNGSRLEWITCLRGEKLFSEKAVFELLPLSFMFVQFFWAAESVNRIAICCSKMQSIQKLHKDKDVPVLIVCAGEVWPSNPADPYSVFQQI